MYSLEAMVQTVFSPISDVPYPLMCSSMRQHRWHLADGKQFGSVHCATAFSAPAVAAAIRPIGFVMRLRPLQRLPESVAVAAVAVWSYFGLMKLCKGGNHLKKVNKNWPKS